MKVEEVYITRFTDKGYNELPKPRGKKALSVQHPSEMCMLQFIREDPFL